MREDCGYGVAVGASRVAINDSDARRLDSPALRKRLAAITVTIAAKTNVTSKMRIRFRAYHEVDLRDIANLLYSKGQFSIANLRLNRQSADQPTRRWSIL